MILTQVIMVATQVIVCVCVAASSQPGDAVGQGVTALTSGTSANTITHTIPSGTFGSTISTAIGIPLITNWETGANIRYKLTNVSEDTGWLTCGITPTVSTFTAFTSEPTSLIVELTPKNPSPTIQYPAIKGFAVYAE